jgi:hypothetical protein
VRSSWLLLAALLGLVFAVSSFEATTASRMLGSAGAVAQEGDNEAAGIEDADDGVLDGEDLSAGADGDLEVDPSGEASADYGQQQAPPPPQEGGIPREVFEKLMERSSEPCQKELAALVESQGQSAISEECNKEASATMAALRAEMGQQQAQGDAEAAQGDAATAEADDNSTTQALIVLAFFGVIVVGGGFAIFTSASKLPAAKVLSPEEAEKKRKAEEKAAAKRKRKGLPPKQPAVDVY